MVSLLPAAAAPPLVSNENFDNNIEDGRSILCKPSDLWLAVRFLFVRSVPLLVVDVAGSFGEEDSADDTRCTTPGRRPPREEIAVDRRPDFGFEAFELGGGVICNLAVVDCPATKDFFPL